MTVSGVEKPRVFESGVRFDYCSGLDPKRLENEPPRLRFGHLLRLDPKRLQNDVLVEKPKAFEP